LSLPAPFRSKTFQEIARPKPDSLLEQYAGFKRLGAELPIRCHALGPEDLPSEIQERAKRHAERKPAA
jgi:hypothetical protein